MYIQNPCEINNAVKAGNNDLDGRKKLKQMKDARHKLEALLTLHTEAVSELTDKRLTESARIFHLFQFLPSIKIIVSCFPFIGANMSTCV